MKTKDSLLALQQINRNLEILHGHLKAVKHYPLKHQEKLVKAVFKEKKEVIVAQCGRNWGKTTAVIYSVLRYAVLNPGSLVWIITPELKQGTKKRLLYPERVKLKNGSWIEEGYNDYNWIDSPDERMKRLNESLNCDIINEGLSTGEMNDLVKTLYKSVDLNVDDDFAIEMIIISADEFMGKRINKNDAKKVLAQFDKKYPRFK